MEKVTSATKRSVTIGSQRILRHTEQKYTAHTPLCEVLLGNGVTQRCTTFAAMAMALCRARSPAHELSPTRRRTGAGFSRAVQVWLQTAAIQEHETDSGEEICLPGDLQFN